MTTDTKMSFREIAEDLSKQIREELDAAFNRGCNHVMDRMDEVQLWYVNGIVSTHYGTKYLAEVAARLKFPDEDPDTRYARIAYHTFFKEKS